MAPTHPPRIMIVDSYGSNIKSLSTHLSGLSQPVQIVPVNDGETALSRLQKEATDLIIIDVCLRGKLDGFELCRALRASPSTQHIPVILLLAGYLSLERSRGMLAGADLLLHRPVVKEELIKMIQLLLGQSLDPAASARVVSEPLVQRKLRQVS